MSDEVDRRGAPQVAARAWWRFWTWSEGRLILAGFGAGALGGLFCNLFLPHDARVAWLLDQVIGPAGEVFLRLIFMIIIPLIVSAFILGVTGLKTWDRLRTLGLRYVLLVLGMT